MALSGICSGTTEYALPGAVYSIPKRVFKY